jgi:hypothetical protein
MLLNRRSVIKQFAFISAGVLLVPSCLQDKSKSGILLQNIKVDADQEKILAELAETIIPATDTPGAKDVSAHLFALMMVDDCYNKTDQEKFIKGLEQFASFAKTSEGKSFVDCSVSQREAILARVSARKSDVDALSFFYSKIKQLTIQAYTSSQYFLTKVQVYEIIPGRYHGCVPVKKANSIKA